jgi:hypothetical protein
MMHLLATETQTRSATRWVRPELAFSLDRDNYGLWATRFRRRLPGCTCASPCLGFRCRTPGCLRTDLTPWCRGCCDDLPNGCDDCWVRLFGLGAT